MNTTKELFYAAVGVGDLAVSKVRKAPVTFDLSQMRKELPKSWTEVRSGAEKAATETVGLITNGYQNLVVRGEKTVKSIRSSAPTKRAAQQTKTAKSQSKAAATSVKKAAEATVEATKEASQKVG